MSFRQTIGPATWISALVAPLMAWFLPAAWGGTSGAEDFPDYVLGGLIACGVAVPVTLLGLILIGWPITYVGERLGRGNPIPIVALNGAVSLLGFVFAYQARWPMIDFQRVFWLTLAISPILFTTLYLRKDAAAAQRILE